jgi:peptidyl-prolyl cis-trans isomerase SurA
MKKRILSTLLLNFAIATTVHAAPLDQIVAVVNDDVVTQSEVNQGLTLAKIQYTQTHQPMPSKEALQKQVTDQLINKKLQLQIAKQAGIKVTDGDVDQIVKNVAAQNNVSVSALYQRIGQEGMSTANYRKELQEQLTIQRVQQQEVGGRLTVTPEEINQALKSVPAAASSGPSLYHLEDILIAIDDDASSQQIADARTKAQAILTQLQQNGYKSDLIKKSNDYQYTDLGWMQLNDMPSAFLEEVKGMNQNSVAGPIQTGNGFHILHLAQVKSPANEGAGESSRKQVEARLLQQKFMDGAEQWVAKMRSQAYIVVNPTT